MMPRAMGMVGDQTREQSDGAFRAATLSVGALLSLMFHGSVLAAFLYLAEQKPGAIQPPTEAISLEAMKSEVLEAVSASQSAAALSAQSVDATIGGPEENAATRPTEIKEIHADKPTQDVVRTEAEVRTSTSGLQGMEVVRGVLESEQSAGSEVTATELDSEESRQPERQLPTRKTTDKPIKRVDAHTDPERSSDTRQKGAAHIRANRGSQRSAGRVSASSGSALNYAALVQARVAARKPDGGGGRGTVVVAFSVSRSGALSSARIARSSGNSSLDSRVLAAVRSAGPFPSPPAGDNLNFAMPFYFR